MLGAVCADGLTEHLDERFDPVPEVLSEWANGLDDHMSHHTESVLYNCGSNVGVLGGWLGIAGDASSD